MKHDAPEVVIIGAGLAGIAASRVLRDQKINHLVLEASPRIGGRIHSDYSLDGVVFERGAGWLHNSQENPLYALFSEAKATFRHDSQILNHLCIDGLCYPSEQVAQEMARMAERLKAAEQKEGTSVLEIIQPNTVLEKAALSHLIGPCESGVELENAAIKDVFVAGGLGLTVQEGLSMPLSVIAEGMPVKTDTPVHKIEWHRKDAITIHTDSGTLSTKHVITTVAPSILQKGGIVFSPNLPAEAEEALHHITMGVLNKILLQFAPNMLPDTPIGFIESFSDNTEIDFVRQKHNPDYLLAFVGGETAIRLEEEGTSALTQFAFTHAQSLFGNGIQLKNARETAWSTDPYSFGAYSATNPEHEGVRQAFSHPIGPLHFAGEAYVSKEHAHWASNMAGAYLSGTTVAQRIVNKIID
jgi:monoamine oxidase